MAEIAFYDNRDSKINKQDFQIINHGEAQPTGDHKFDVLFKDTYGLSPTILQHGLTGSKGTNYVAYFSLVDALIQEENLSKLADPTVGLNDESLSGLLEKVKQAREAAKAIGTIAHTHINAKISDLLKQPINEFIHDYIVYQFTGFPQSPSEQDFQATLQRLSAVTGDQTLSHQLEDRTRVQEVVKKAEIAPTMLAQARLAALEGVDFSNQASLTRMVQYGIIFQPQLAELDALRAQAKAILNNPTSLTLILEQVLVLTNEVAQHPANYQIDNVCDGMGISGGRSCHVTVSELNSHKVLFEFEAGLDSKEFSSGTLYLNNVALYTYQVDRLVLSALLTNSNISAEKKNQLSLCDSENMNQVRRNLLIIFNADTQNTPPQ